MIFLAASLWLPIRSVADSTALVARAAENQAPQFPAAPVYKIDVIPVDPAQDALPPAPSYITDSFPPLAVGDDRSTVNSNERPAGGKGRGSQVSREVLNPQIQKEPQAEPGYSTGSPSPIMEALPEIPARLTRFVPESGTWLEIPGTSVASVLVQPGEFPFCDDIKCYNVRSAFYDWNGAVFDPVGLDWYFPAGGGHAEYGGNEVYRFDFNTLTWARITDPSPLGGPMVGTNNACQLPVTGPGSSHTYDAIAWLGDRLVVFPTVPYCSSGMIWSGTAATFGPAALTWTEHPTINPNITYGANGGLWNGTATPRSGVMTST
jgi:hypothetical protein